MNAKMKTHVVLSLLLFTGIFTSTVLWGCATYGPARQSQVSGSARSVDPALSSSTFFDGQGVLRADRLDGRSKSDEVWIISRPMSGPFGPPIRNAQGFSPIGVVQDSFNLIDLIGETEIDTEVEFENTFGSGNFFGAPSNRKYVDLRHYINPCGGIIGIATDGAEKKLIPVALQHTEVHADIAAYIATVDVKQQFYNPYNDKIEAVYVFPMPEDAAVSEFVMTIGDRKIRGIIREREEAAQIYEQAKRRGYNASLLEQQRPNIFTQKVANIEPGKQIDINIRYFHTLSYDDGWYEFAFPMVVGPRFNPPGSADPVNAVSRRSPHQNPNNANGTDVPYMLPTERSGHDIGLTVDINAGVEIEEIKCNSHVVEHTRINSSQSRVTLSSLDSIPNKDFVLRYRVAGDRIKTALLTQRDSSNHGGNGHFTLMIYPPQELINIERKPLEMVFVLDCSGSMSGEPIVLAKRAVKRALQQMNPDDSFQIIRFSDTSSTFGARPVAATEANIRQGIQYVNNLNANGGTMMINGIKQALDFPHDPERQRYVVFLTDGFIGNEQEILGEMSRRLDDSRVFSFGIGSSPNTFLLERMAQLGEGVVAYVGLNDSPVGVMDRFVERVAHPAMENVKIDFGAMQVSDVFPYKTADLFIGRPIVLTGRYQGEGRATVRVNGIAGSRDILIPIEVNMQQGTAGNEGIAKVWARTKIAQIMNDESVESSSETQSRVMAVALQYGLMSAYTSFIAVDSSHVTEGEFGTTVTVPVPVPDGIRYETTVGR